MNFSLVLKIYAKIIIRINIFALFYLQYGVGHQFTTKKHQKIFKVIGKYFWLVAVDNEVNTKFWLLYFIKTNESRYSKGFVDRFTQNNVNWSNINEEYGKI